MKLKTRLIIGFMSVIILPLCLSVTVIFAFAQFQIRAIEKTYGVSNSGYQMISNPITVMDEMTDKTYQQLKITANREPEKFTDKDYLDSINDELLEKNSYLIVIHGEDVLFEGSKERRTNLEPDAENK